MNYYNLACAFAEEGAKREMLANLSLAFRYKSHIVASMYPIHGLTIHFKNMPRTKILLSFSQTLDLNELMKFALCFIPFLVLWQTIGDPNS